jgi:hypothetical protein
MNNIIRAREILESRIQGLPGVLGTGMSFSDKQIIIYISDSNAEQTIRNKVGSQVESFKLKFVYSGKIRPMM